MADFLIDVGFDTAKLKRELAEIKKSMAVTSSGGGGEGKANTLEVGVSSGVVKALKSLGIIAILNSIQIISDLLAFLLGLINGAIGALLGFFIQYIIPFFKDPFRVLLQLGLFIVNGIIAGLEALINFIPGVSGVTLPRFQEEFVLEAYDKMKEDIKQAGDDANKVKEARQMFVKRFGESLMKEEDFQKLKDYSISTNKNLLESYEEIKKNGEGMTDFVESSTKIVKSATDNAMKSVSDLMDYIKRKAQGLMGSGGSGGGSMSTYSSATKSTSNYSNVSPGMYQTSDAQAASIQQKYGVNLNFKPNVSSVPKNPLTTTLWKGAS